MYAEVRALRAAQQRALKALGLPGFGHGVGGAAVGDAPVKAEASEAPPSAVGSAGAVEVVGSAFSSSSSSSCGVLDLARQAAVVREALHRLAHELDGEPTPIELAQTAAAAKAAAAAAASSSMAPPPGMFAGGSSGGAHGGLAPPPGMGHAAGGRQQAAVSTVRAAAPAASASDLKKLFSILNAAKKQKK